MTDSTIPTPKMSNSVYDTLKWIAQILLPALGALYFSLGEIWGLPKVTEVVGTIAVVDTFLGVLLGLSTAKYNRSDARFDGKIELSEREDGGTTASMVLKDDPEVALEKNELNFKVDKEAVDIPVNIVKPRNSRGQFSSE